MHGKRIAERHELPNEIPTAPVNPKPEDLSYKERINEEEQDEYRSTLVDMTPDHVWSDETDVMSTDDLEKITRDLKSDEMRPPPSGEDTRVVPIRTPRMPSIAEMHVREGPTTKVLIGILVLFFIIGVKLATMYFEKRSH